jgi:hypothetical protein
MHSGEYLIASTGYPLEAIREAQTQPAPTSRKAIGPLDSARADWINDRYLIVSDLLPGIL